MAKKISKKKTTTKKKAVAKKAPAKKKPASKKVASKKPAPKKAVAATVVKKKAAAGKTTKAKAATTKKKTASTSKKKSAAKKKPRSSVASREAAAAAAAAVQPVKSDSDALAIDWTEAKLRRVKTGLRKKDLDGFKILLMEKRAEIVGDVKSLESANTTAGNLSNMPLHMADVGSDNYEQEFTLGLVESERRLLTTIDDALVRLNKGFYGVCVESGEPIPAARLEIKPWAKYTIEVVRERERRGLAS